MQPVARALLARDALRADAYGGLSLRARRQADPQGRGAGHHPCRRRAGATAARRSDGPADPLFEALREARRRLAAEAGVPPYVIFHDSTLREIAERKPRNLNELAHVQGVGAAKLERYGEAMLAVLSTNG